MDEKNITHGKLKTARAALAFLLAALFALPPQSAAAQASVRQEYELKAGFLYQFTQFVEWPPEKIQEPENFVLCALEGPASLPEEFEVLRQEEVYGLKIEIRITGDKDLEACHAIFIPAARRGDFNDILKKIGDRPILTIAESTGFLERGGIINFIRQGRKIRFEINQKSAERAGLKISSKLLKLASRVIT